MEEVLTMDFETEAIQDRPHYPPKPVGVALKHLDGSSEYLAWGHPTGNNATFEQGREALVRYWNREVPVLCHNAKFDLDVAEQHMDLPMPSWHNTHDTMYQLYLYNPHARTISLKPSAEQILDWPPEERDALQAWIEANVSGLNKKDNPWGAHICDAPGDLVGEYAIGDVERTYGLHEFLIPYLLENGMEEAYDRERELMPILLESERRGIRVDMPLLEHISATFEDAWCRIDDDIFSIIGQGEFNINSGAQLASALKEAGMVGTLPLTPTGRESTSQAALAASIQHSRLLQLLAYRGGLKTALTTFIRPWTRLAEANNGRLHTTWHQTRGTEKFGTRTGRISSSHPNFTNVPNEFKAVAPEGYPPLPLLRGCLLPEEGHVWVKRDYSSQEIRVGAHFEDGELMKAYQENPALDPHAMAQEIVRTSSGYIMTRKQIKIIAFSLIYGTGVKGLSERQNISYQEAGMTKELYLSAVPGLRQLMDDVKARGAAGLPVRTTGGRLLFSEPPINNRRFDYKLLNHLIQGSSADMTKQAMINYSYIQQYGSLLAQVYDELNISVPEEYADKEMLLLKQAMESVSLDVLPLSEGYFGNNWLEADKE